MKFLVAYSVIHNGGNFISSTILDVPTLASSEDVEMQHIENWNTIRIPNYYRGLNSVSVHVLSFQPLKG